jgi:galactokinase
MGPGHGFGLGELGLRELVDLYGGPVQLIEDFHARTGTTPTVLGSAPGRVNVIGEHLDYNGGASLPIALTHRTEVAAATRDDGLLVVESRQAPARVTVPMTDLRGSAPVPVQGWAAYVAGVLWALDVDRLGLAGGATLLVDGRVPSGAGLSSSAALECATAMAVCALAGAEPSREEVVAACVRAENDYVGAPTGTMDQTVAVFAEPGHALLIDFAEGSRTPVPWAPDGDLLVVDTRAAHALVGGEYAERRRSCEEAARRLGVRWLAGATGEGVDHLDDPVLRRRARHVVTETERVGAAVEALRAEDWERLGSLLTASHHSLRDDFEVSCPELDVAVEAALRAGARGARMTGGGFGGSAIALVPPGRTDAIREAVTAAYAEAGFTPPAFLDGSAGGPAEAHPL